jgi:hypothetical protein
VFECPVIVGNIGCFYMEVHHLDLGFSHFSHFSPMGDSS